MAGHDIEKQPAEPRGWQSSSHAKAPEVSPESLDPSTQHVNADKLARKLSARQVQMIAIGGTIGTGLFLGTGKALATGGPASMLIAYTICGAIVFVTMLCLGEMAAFIPVAGSFCTFAGWVVSYPWFRHARSNSIRRFVDDALGFALTWNYWFNDAVSTASDIIALQLLLEFWTDNFPGWAISLIFLVVVIALNLLSVKVYGEVCTVVFYYVRRTKLIARTGGILAQFTQGRDHSGMPKPA